MLLVFLKCWLEESAGPGSRFEGAGFSEAGQNLHWRVYCLPGNGLLVSLYERGAIRMRTLRRLRWMPTHDLPALPPRPHIALAQEPSREQMFLPLMACCGGCCCQSVADLLWWFRQVCWFRHSTQMMSEPAAFHSCVVVT